MNARAPRQRRRSSRRPRSCRGRSGSAEKRSSAGASRAHGPHQLAQKTTSAGRPPAPASRLASVTGPPDERSRGSAGAGRPLEECDASPNTASAASAAASTSVQPSSRSRRAIARPLRARPGGVRRGRFPTAEARRVQRQPLARAGDPVDDPRVVDELRLLGVAFGAHAPRLPHARQFLGRADQVLHPAGHLVARQKRRDRLRRVPARVHRDGDDLHFGGHLRAPSGSARPAGRR